VIGGGNNLLVRDRGVRGVVLRLEGCLGRAEFHGEEAIVGAGVSLSALIREASALNLGGIECLVGIPATIGGALAMNAGTPDGWIGDFVSAVYFLHSDGSLGEFKPTSGTFTYRAFDAPPGAVLIGCRLRLTRRPLAEIQKDTKVRLKHKKATQPLALASAGCVWNNPAGDLADRAADLGERSVFVARQRVGKGPRRKARQRGRLRRVLPLTALAVAAPLAVAFSAHWLLTTPRFAVVSVDVRGASRVPTAEIL